MVAVSEEIDIAHSRVNVGFGSRAISQERFGKKVADGMSEFRGHSRATGHPWKMSSV